MRSACHHAQMDVARVNVLTSAIWGLTTMEHWYGLPEALLALGELKVEHHGPGEAQSLRIRRPSLRR